jgi:hypothetical protein
VRQRTRTKFFFRYGQRGPNSAARNAHDFRYLVATPSRAVEPEATCLELGESCLIPNRQACLCQYDPSLDDPSRPMFNNID